MRTPIAMLTAALLAGCATTPVLDVPVSSPAAMPTAVFSQGPLDASITSDLPRTARPLHYEITITPDAENLIFAGTSAVRVEVYQETSTIVMHANALDISSARLAEDGASDFSLLDVAGYDEALQTVTLHSETPILPGTYTITTEYTGQINTQAAGLFALDYPDKRTGEEVRGLFTQFQAPDARRFVPMFDEPAYKATFDLTAIVPAEAMAVSNMPAATEEHLGDGMKRVAFQTSPLMSSYLLFFALGDFERASMTAPDGTDIGIVAPSGSGEQTQYALESMAPLMPWFTDYFGLAYPLPKLDNVTAPGQSQFFGAMENWGAILTFERILLNDPAITSTANRQSIFNVQVHEVAHQWFGNIVTMAWWDDLWLNEGFASWLDTKVTAELNPEWDFHLRRVGVREGAMSRDAFASTHPVIQEITTVAETAQAFDTITYSKGEALIAMFEDYAGEDVWRDGLRDYFQQHTYGNTTSPDLWAAIEGAGAVGLTDIAERYANQPGVPLVMAEGVCTDGSTTITLTQSEFSRDRQDEVAADPQSWLVPLNIDGGMGAHTVVLDGQAQHSVNGCDAPLVVNAGQNGYYRTLYSDALASRIANGFADLPPVDQLGLLRDSSALALAQYQPLARPMALLAQVPVDAHPNVAELAVDTLVGVRSYLGEEHEAERAILARMATDRGLPRLLELGFDPLESDSVLDSNLRAGLIGALGSVENPEVLAQAAARFEALRSNPRSLDGPLKTTWLAIATSNADQEQWDLLARLAANASSASERQTYYQRLGSVRDETLARRALDFAITGEAGTASATIIRAVSNRYPDMALNFAMDNMEEVRGLVDPSGWQGYLAFLALGAEEDATLQRLEEYAATLSAGEAAPIRQVQERMASDAQANPRLETEVLEWVRNHGG